ncbi:hypothetical protein QFC19_006773 [Naganishia cerealis]|uniref:Uncharacterized protein n=1 Tax=Naganishia cerealis TaxID=610337 RepID=A0ACC2VDF6_9TREE|nr:hypothetical protein QFC19_006773 [Naganishia cerealis]
MQEEKLRQVDSALLEMEDACKAVTFYLPLFSSTLCEVLKEQSLPKSPAVEVLERLHNVIVEKQKFWMKFCELFDQLSSQRQFRNHDRLSGMRFKVDFMSLLWVRLYGRSWQSITGEVEVKKSQIRESIGDIADQARKALEVLPPQDISDGLLISRKQRIGEMDGHVDQIKQSLAQIEGAVTDGGFPKLYQKAYAALDILPDYFPVERTKPSMHADPTQSYDVVSLKVEGKSISAESIGLTKESLEGDADFLIRVREILERFPNFTVEINPSVSALNDTRFATDLKSLETSFLSGLKRIASDFEQAGLSFTVTLNATLEQ